ncbi:MAG: methylmalonyl-CoA mutase family protein [bacterium]|nr:methylmalonyl-CoA mutase family protein [bacterium]
MKRELPGEYPFTNGIHPSMYDVENGGRLWTIRQFSGYGTPRQTNGRFKKLEAMGQRGRSVAFDMPTLLGFDSDNPIAEADVGMGGVAVDTVKDFEILFSGLNLNPPFSTSMTINGPATVLLSMYFELAKKRCYDLSTLRGTTQNDPLKEFIAQKEWIVPPKPSMKLLVDTFEYVIKYYPAPKWNVCNISDYHIREAGASPIQASAFLLADAIATVEVCLERGLAIDDIARHLSFFLDFYFDFEDDIVVEISRHRATRRMWAKIMRERFKAKNFESWKFRYHTQTAGRSLTQEQSLNNIARVAFQALGAVLSGTQSLHTNSFDEQQSLPSEKAVKVALRTQQIIAFETGITKYPDILAGSYEIERKTDQVENEVQKILNEIDSMGGMVSAVERGWPQAKIEDYEFEYRKKAESGKIKIVGQNIFADEKPGESNFSVPEKSQETQIKFLKKVKAERSKNGVTKALDDLRKTTEKGANVMPEVAEAVKAIATEEEICNVFREFYGIYYEEV